MTGALAPFLAGWSLMMAAMMLPSAVPIIRLHRLSAVASGWERELGSAAFVAGYLLVWSVVGIAVWVAAAAVDALLPAGAQALAVAALLMIAGLYQFTPLKSRCLGACRSPMDFLVTRWRGGAAGALRIGVDHGVYCLGCCWALMTVFVGVGAMAVTWAAGIAAVVAAEKLLPGGRVLSRALGLALIAGGALVLAWPDLAMLLPAGM
ncbi:MAG TPA: DUF2182 domain-containing protein [Candidatus Limnocylindria bacterium]